MTMKEMANAVAEGINARGIKAEVAEVTKNGIINYGVTIGEGVVRPTFYVREDGKVNNMINEFVEQYNNLPENNFGELIKDFTDFDKIKGKIIPVLNMRNDESLVTRQFLDMTLVYKIMLSDEASVTVKKEHLKSWNVTEDDIYNVAIENARGTFSLTTMGEMLGMSELDDESNPMYVATNENKLFAAAAMLYKDTFTELYNSYGKLAILPSSIHELLILKYDDNADELNDMVRTVNMTQVDPKEWLSDHIYIFNGNEVVMDA